MSLIKREDLIEHLNLCLAESDGGTPITDAVITVIRCVVEQMQEVDAVPVVRCGECAKSKDDIIAENLCFCYRFNCGMQRDEYCSCGERRADNEKKELS